MKRYRLCPNSFTESCGICQIHIAECIKITKNTSCSRNGTNKQKAKDIIIKTDKKRASYYNYYTNKTWGEAKGYDLCINSAKLGIGGTAKAIIDYVNLKNKIEKPRL